ncbi:MULTISPECIES: pilus assembly protein [Bacillaceae]|uniref:pilus assembly protein n=1 Tax=Bacillaceae TaxID=186817 RepID=UPI001C58F77B|nr:MULTISPECIES: pilus assembly protein [Rossellomorea]MBW3110723.1 pilus assembly protein [Bacillus sp. MCCB 382]MDX8346035.1 pilus assembly protein [Rossellomorea sp. YZS02]
MRKYFKKVNNEKGALTFEFLGILPFFFMFFLLLWQVVASGYAIYTVKTAVNEGAKSYSATKDALEAENTVKKAIGASNVITYDGMSITTPDVNGKFEINVKVEHPLVFIPKQWKDETALSFDQSAVGQVLVE